MKRQSLAKLTVLFLILMVFVSCRTAETNANEILKASIDLATEYAKAGEYDKAIDVYDRAWSQLEDYRLLYNKAMTLAACGRYSQAIIVCREGIEKFPMIMAFRTALASFSDSDTAVLEQILELDPYNSVIRLKLMNLLYQNGDTERAKYHASILWDQGTINADTAKVLEYNSLYEILTRTEVSRQQPQEESTQSGEPS